jgi:hypothetical protein
MLKGRALRCAAFFIPQSREGGLGPEEEVGYGRSTAPAGTQGISPIWTMRQQ